MDYISKAECERRGFKKGADGLYRKLSTLEKYAEKGWLDFGDKRLMAADRLSAGLSFFKDFRRSRILNLPAVNLEKERVDTSGKKDIAPEVWDARQRFGRALRSINGEYLNIVVWVCLDDKPLNIVKITNAQYNHDLEMAKEYLCRGLDNLAFHYGVKPIRRQKIRGMVEVKFFDDLDDWLEKVK